MTGPVSVPWLVLGFVPDADSEDADVDWHPASRHRSFDLKDKLMGSRESNHQPADYESVQAHEIANKAHHPPLIEIGLSLLRRANT